MKLGSCGRGHGPRIGPVQEGQLTISGQTQHAEGADLGAGTARLSVTPYALKRL